MGEIIGAGVVSHVPTIVMPEDDRKRLNNGQDLSLVEGLERLRSERLDKLNPETVVVIDTHWFTTVEHIITAHDRRKGIFTSDELPRGMSQVPYDMPGDPELAFELEKLAAGRGDTRILACDDPYLPVHYPTINLLGFLQRKENWISVGVCQTAEVEDFLLLGELLRKTIETLDRNVVILASGGLSHRFWPLRDFAKHESSSLENIRTPEARKADEEVIELWESGNHEAVIDFYPEYRTYAPEGFFGHYLIMTKALGKRLCKTSKEKYSDYESATDTNQVHI